MNFKQITCALLLSSAMFPALADTREKTPAFPGAEGFGRYVTGGRGGAVYHVTSLADDGSAGTLRWALNQNGARTIVFDVAGTIHLTSSLNIGKGNVTVAGQTSPGGICLADYPVSIHSNNVILRYLRFRVGNKNVTLNGADGWDGLGAMDQKDIMVDHCSISWSIDECCSIYGSQNLTVQWCLIAQSLVNSGHSKGAHGYGGNWGGSGATYHHNLMAHHVSRVPRLGPRQTTQTDERLDMRNNVFYNWSGNGCYGGEGMNVNIVNNYYKPGPGTNAKKGAIKYRLAAPGIRTVDYCLNKDAIAKSYNDATGKSFTKDDVYGSSDGMTNYVIVGSSRYPINMADNTITVNGKSVAVSWNGWAKMLHVWGKFYVDGNVNPDYAYMTKDNFRYGVAEQIDKNGNDKTYPGDDAIRLTTPMAFTGVTTQSAEVAYARVLDYVGASNYRDSFDEMMVSDTRNGKASHTGSGLDLGFVNTPYDNVSGSADPYPVLKATAAAPADTDGDGIPDEWEKGHGLNPNDAADGKEKNADGYTNLEVYLNSLVEDITTKQNEGGTFEGTIDEEEEQVAAEYELNQDTSNDNWTFSNGFSITSSKGYAEGKSCGMAGIKYSRGVDFTINIPSGLAVTKVEIQGYGNDDNNDAYLQNLGEQEFGTSEYVFPSRAGNENKTYTIELATPTTGTLPFKFNGAQVVANFKIYTVSATGIKNIPADKNKDGKVYTLDGKQVAKDYKGVAIKNGKKIIIK